MFTSKYKLKITGKDVKRFIKKLYINKIFIEEIEISNNIAYITVDKDNYKKILDIKTIYEIELIRLYGFVKLIDLLSRFKVLIICLCIGFIYYIFLSNIIFKVDVIHSKKDIRDLIYKELKYYGIEKYSFIKSYDKKELIENKILNKHKDKIEWIEIERVGVRYVVKVEERIIKNKTKNKSPRNIIAKKDGIIYKIDAYKGEVIKKVGDYVKKGDVIISGLIMKKDEIKNEVAADGIVYAEVWYKTNVSIPYYYNEVNYLGNNRKALKFKILGNIYNIYPFKKYKSSKNKNIFSITNNLLPIELNFVNEEETNEIEKIYSVEEAISEAKKESFNKMKSKLNNDEKIILEKVLEVHEYENYVNVILFYKVYENISLEKEISNKEKNNL